jgi:N-acyl homoserine lactone hydrolase
VSLAIHPLRFGDINGDTSVMSLFWRPGVRRLVPVSAFLILGADTPIMVDAGVRPDLAESQEEITTGPANALDAVLAAHGMEPGDIGKVVMTHLHMDHTGLIDQLSNARVFVQRAEIQYAAAPHYPTFFYDRVDIAKLVGPLFPRIECLDGDTEIVAGVRTVVTGGHTPGHQMVYVDVPSGQAIITGDVIYLADRALSEGAPPGYFVNLADTQAAIDRVRRDANHVLPMHDPEIYDKYPAGVT